MRKIILALFLLSGATNTALADLPLTVEDLLTAQNRYRLEFGVNYANSDRRNIDSQFDLIQTGSGSFVLCKRQRISPLAKSPDLHSMATRRPVSPPYQPQ